MQTVIVVIHLMLVLGLIGAVLLQRSEGGGLGIGSGGGGAGGFMTSRGTANVLTRTTALLALGFFITSLVLSWMAGYDRKPTSILNSTAPASQSAPGTTPPINQGGGNLLDSLKGQGSGDAAPAAPGAPPAGPQVPRSQ